MPGALGLVLFETSDSTDPSALGFFLTSGCCILAVTIPGITLESKDGEPHENSLT